MDEKPITRMSRFLSFVLRHNPDAAGVKLNPYGWVDVSSLIAGGRRAGFALDPEILRLIVDNDEKRRYALSADGMMIRANYGHSIPVDLGVKPLVPPEHLFHGTADRNLSAIKAGGLQSRKRQYVHLSKDIPTATAVARRHGTPVVLTVRALDLHARGCKFYHSESDIWLTKYVPPGYIIFP